MRALGRRWSLPALGFLLTAAPLAGQATLAGLVREDGTNRPLPGVQVVVEGSKRQGQTDLAGRYELNAPIGRQVALYRAIGYRPVRMLVDLYKGETFRSDILMVPERAQPLDPVVVSALPALGVAGLAGFEARRRLGFGQFIDSTDLRRSEHLTMQDLLRRVQGIKLVRFQECEQLRPRGTRCGPLEIRAASTRSGVRGSYCWMQVVMDGAVVFRSVSPGGVQVLDHPPDFASEFDIAGLDAVEIYRSSAETPIEFGQGGVPCGAIVLWSRRGGYAKP